MHKLALLFATATSITNAVSQNVTTFNPPTVEPFVHLNLLASLPTNTSTTLGLRARYPNEGGNVTGEINGEVLPLGAASELLVTESRSFYTNQWTINTTNTTLLMNAEATITYANKALFGIGPVSFDAEPGAFGDIRFERFIGLVSGDFNTGQTVMDVFKLGPHGRVDGQPIPALLPPGQGEE